MYAKSPSAGSLVFSNGKQLALHTTNPPLSHHSTSVCCTKQYTKNKKIQKHENIRQNPKRRQTTTAAAVVSGATCCKSQSAQGDRFKSMTACLTPAVAGPAGASPRQANKNMLVICHTRRLQVDSERHGGVGFYVSTSNGTTWRLSSRQTTFSRAKR